MSDKKIAHKYFHLIEFAKYLENEDHHRFYFEELQIIFETGVFDVKMEKLSPNQIRLKEENEKLRKQLQIVEEENKKLSKEINNNRVEIEVLRQKLEAALEEIE